MDGLSNEHIATLLSPKRGQVSKSSTGRQALVRAADGTLDKVAVSVLSSVGYFEGKQGTIRRSRKGATRIQPNGSRYYCPNFDQEVIAYQPARA